MTEDELMDLQEEEKDTELIDEQRLMEQHERSYEHEVWWE